MIDNYNINIDEPRSAPTATHIRQNKNNLPEHFVFLHNIYDSLKTNVDIIKNDLDRFMTNYSQGSGNESLRRTTDGISDIQTTLIKLTTTIDHINSETDKFQDYLFKMSTVQPDILNEVRHIASMVANQVDKDTVHLRKSEHVATAVSSLTDTVSTITQTDQNFTDIKLAIADLIRSIDVIHPVIQKSNDIDSSVADLSKDVSALKPLIDLQDELKPVAKFFKLATKPLGIIIIIFTLLLSLMAASAGLYKIVKLFKPEKVKTEIVK